MSLTSEKSLRTKLLKSIDSTFFNLDMLTKDFGDVINFDEEPKVVLAKLKQEKLRAETEVAKSQVTLATIKALVASIKSKVEDSEANQSKTSGEEDSATPRHDRSSRKRCAEAESQHRNAKVKRYNCENCQCRKGSWRSDSVRESSQYQDKDRSRSRASIGQKPSSGSGRKSKQEDVKAIKECCNKENKSPSSSLKQIRIPSSVENIQNLTLGPKKAFLYRSLNNNGPKRIQDDKENSSSEQKKVLKDLNINSKAFVEPKNKSNSEIVKTRCETKKNDKKKSQKRTDKKTKEISNGCSNGSKQCQSEKGNPEKNTSEDIYREILDIVRSNDNSIRHNLPVPNFEQVFSRKSILKQLTSPQKNSNKKTNHQIISRSRKDSPATNKRNSSSEISDKLIIRDKNMQDEVNSLYQHVLNSKKDIKEVDNHSFTSADTYCWQRPNLFEN